jgi:NAD(P) transhydrogenase subunit alpha
MDVVIGTALIPGKPSPLILSQDLMALLKTGAVVVDLAVSKQSPGNCAGSKPQETVITPQEVMVVGDAYPTSHYARDASALYARNLLEFVKLLWDAENKRLRPSTADDLLAATCICEALEGETPHTLTA